MWLLSFSFRRIIIRWVFKVLLEYILKVWRLKTWFTSSLFLHRLFSITMDLAKSFGIYFDAFMGSFSFVSLFRRLNQSTKVKILNLNALFEFWVCISFKVFIFFQCIIYERGSVLQNLFEVINKLLNNNRPWKR